MSDFAPTNKEQRARARADLRIGLPVILSDANGAAICVAVENLDAARLKALQGLGDIHMALTDRRAQVLNMPAYDGDVARLEVPAGADLRWLRAMADPADDLRHPMKGPVRAIRAGDAGLARDGIALCKEAQLLPAVLMVALPDPDGFAAVHGLTHLSVGADAGAAQMHPVAQASLPMALAQNGRLRIFRPKDGGIEHYAIEIGRLDREAPVLCRLHSACFTGDVLGSLKCDCGPQLHAALAAMENAGAGVLLYLNQEGRGIGLANKMRAYDLQDQGFDTVESNHRLGFEDDERDFTLGAQILAQMGIAQVRLLTNNPRKVDRLTHAGITVTDRVPLKVGRNPLNAKYLDIKAQKSGHLF